MRLSDRDSSRNKQAGFSLAELMIVIMIIMTVSAIAVPTLINTVADVRLRSSASSLQGELQQLRMRAVKDNQPYTARSFASGGEILVYMDTIPAGNPAGNSTFDAGELAVSLANDVTIESSGNPSNTSMGISGIGSFTSAATVAVTFNARGLPCSGTGGCTTAQGYVYYLSQNRSVGSTAWAAVTVTPAGRIKTWRWNGTSWN